MSSKLKVEGNCLWIVAALALLASIRPGIAAADISSLVAFDIRPQPVPAALLKFSAQSGVQITSSGEALEGKSSPGVVGRLIARAALDKLLKGTGLRYDVVDRNTIAIRMLGTNEAAARASPNSKSPASATVAKAANGSNPAFVRAPHALQGPQKPLDPPQQLKMVEITGTRILAPNLTSESPITVLNAAQIQDQGTTDVETMLNQLPQFHAGQNTTTNINATGVDNLNLRGLGPTRTLVLIDGFRLGPGDVQDAHGSAADVNFIPPARVGRVDVLTGGASAVYGSDAIAGVVNFHLIHDFQGLKITETASADQHTQSGTLDPVLKSAGYPKPIQIPGNQFDGFISDTTILMGTDTPDHRGNITMYVEYRDTTPVLNGTRDFQGCATTLNQAMSALICGGNGDGQYGHFYTNSGQELALNPNETATFVPFTTSNPNLKYSNSQGLSLQREDTKTSLGAIGHEQLNPWVDVYGKVMYMQDETTAVQSPSGLPSGGGPTTGDIQVPCNDPFLSDAEEPYICQDAAGNPLPRYQADGQPNVATIFMPGLTFANYPIPVHQQHNDNFIVLGVRGKINSAWSYDVSGTYWRTLLSERIQNDIDFGKTQNAINGCTAPVNPGTAPCVPLNIFQYGAITPAEFNYITTPGLATGHATQSTINAGLSGNFGPYGGTSPWAEHPVAVALGVQRRTETLHFVPDYEVQTGQLLNTGFFPPVSGSESIAEEYLEVRLPLIENKPFVQSLNVDAAGRHSTYHFSAGGQGVSTNTFKLGADYAPSHDVRFRASFNRAVRAPNLYELFLPRTTQAETGIGDPCADPTPTASLANCEKTGVTPGEYGNIIQCPALNCQGLFGGNPALKPEAATTVTVGLIATPHFLPEFMASIDYWDIDIKDYITNLSYASIVQGCLLNGNNGLCPLIHRGNVGQLFGATGYAVETNTNFGGLHNRGIDLNLSYLRPLPRDWGSIGLTMTGSYLLKQAVSTTISYDCAGLYGPVCSAGGDPGPDFRWRHDARITWLTPWNLDLSLNWRYLSSASLDLNSSQPALFAGVYDTYFMDAKIPAYNYFDVSAAWYTLKWLTLRFGVTNLLDKDPPINSDYAVYNNNGGAGGNIYTGTYDSLGRVLFLSLSAKL